MRSFIPAPFLVLILLGVYACGPDPKPSNEALAPSTPKPSPTERLKIVVLGDSISAGLGLAEGQAFPSVVQRRLKSVGLEVALVNAGVSGDTTAGGLERLDWLLRQKPDILVVELGANDALRGQPLTAIEANLRAIVERGQQEGAHVVLLGMDVPSNYGPDYGQGFAQLYERIAVSHELTWIPGFLREVGTNSELMQSDGLHPTAAGQEQLADQLTPVLEKVIRSLLESS